MTHLIMIPGMMCDARLFAPQIDAFRSQYEVEVASISSHTRIDELAANVLERAPHKFALAGLSMGGIVAMEICAQAPDRVVKLALMDTNPMKESDEIKQWRKLQIQEVMDGKLQKVVRDDLKPKYLADTPNKQAILDICMKMALSLGPNVFLRQSIALRDRLDQQETLQSLDIPTLILCGAEDRLCSPDKHKLMHDLITNSRLEVIMNAGHMPTLEQPEKTTEALRLWLTR